jgi:hypothetical protein
MNAWLEAAWLDAATITTASGAGGNVTVNVRPAAGERWCLPWLTGYHDDAARDAIWYWIGAPGGSLELSRRTALATSTQLPFYSANEDALKVPFLLPLIATYSQYPQLFIAGMAGAKNAYVRYLAYKLRGTGEWGNT